MNEENRGAFPERAFWTVIDSTAKEIERTKAAERKAPDIGCRIHAAQEDIPKGESKMRSIS